MKPLEKQKYTEKGLCLLEMYFGDSVRRTKNYLRIIMLLEINILLRLLELLILQKLLKISVLFFIICVFPSRFSLPTKITVYKYNQRCEKYNKYAKTCSLFEQNLNNKKNNKMSCFSCTGSVLYNAPERENKS